MSRVTRPAVMLAVAVACALVFSGAANAAPLPHYGPTTCKGGKIRSGSYASLRITGVCTLGNRAYTIVRGNLVVGNHGILNAITHGHLVRVGQPQGALAAARSGSAARRPSGAM